MLSPRVGTAVSGRVSLVSLILLSAGGCALSAGEAIAMSALGAAGRGSSISPDALATT